MGSGSFPSGHMTVFAALGIAVLLYYPKYRKPVIIFLVLLGIALIGTDYHFLSDVIGGAYLGFITTYSLYYIFEKKRPKL
jgi:membrane-associated phospholipid phosphatase